VWLEQACYISKLLVEGSWTFIRTCAAYPGAPCVQEGKQWTVSTEQIARAVKQAVEHVNATGVYIATQTPATHPKCVPHLSPHLRLRDCVSASAALLVYPRGANKVSKTTMYSSAGVTCGSA
jgi:hypothetical protein